MVVKTLDISQPAINTDRADSRSDMFAQSNALYSRINKKSKASPWMIIAPIAVVVLVGGALVATSGMHSTVPAKPAPVPAPAASTPAPAETAPMKTVSSKTVKSTTTSIAPAPKSALRVEPARPVVRQAASRVPTTARTPVNSGSAPSAYDHQSAAPAVTAATPAPSVNTQPATVTPAPAPSTPAPTTVAPATPDAAPAPTPATPPSQ